MGLYYQNRCKESQNPLAPGSPKRQYCKEPGLALSLIIIVSFTEKNREKGREDGKTAQTCRSHPGFFGPGSFYFGLSRFHTPSFSMADTIVPRLSDPAILCYLYYKLLRLPRSCFFCASVFLLFSFALGRILFTLYCFGLSVTSLGGHDTSFFFLLVLFVYLSLPFFSLSTHLDC